MIGGIILAAGLSTRMDGPTPKQLLTYRGRPLVQVVAASATASDLDQVVVVTGHRGDDVAAAVEGLDVTVAHNPDFAEGNMTSFRTGYSALAGCEAFVILLADTPGVTPSMINEYISTWSEQQPWAAVGSYSDGTGHPLLLSAAAMREAAPYDGARAVWRLLEKAPDGAVAPIVFETARPTDVNTVDDYELLD